MCRRAGQRSIAAVATLPAETVMTCLHTTPFVQRALPALVCLLALAAGGLQAAWAEDDKTAADQCGNVGERGSFAAHREKYFLVNQMHNNGWAANDERALRAQYSFKYAVMGCPLRPQGSNLHSLQLAGRNDAEVFLSYTGQFDFYMGTRPSGPVINRISNPGLHWRVAPKWLPKGLSDVTSWELSLEHRSDGQVFEPTTPQGSEIANRAYRLQDRALFDTISRGANYLGVQALWVPTGDLAGFDLRAKARLYLTRDSNITWGPLANQGVTIAGYDLLELKGGWDAGRVGRLEATWRVGNRGLRGDSLDFSWEVSPQVMPAKLQLPLYVRMHVGPMNTLSNYTQRQDSLGIGLRFDHF
jgi:hypothetical protein